MNQIIKKETINRLLKDVKQIIQNPLSENGIYYLHDDTDILKGYALIIGPEDTPYFGGNYFFEIKYPTDYPHTPPSVNYCTNGNNVRFNPNLYKCGKVCVSLLNTWRGEQWTSCQTISTVLLTLCTLLCEDPLLNEPGITKTHKDFDKYTEIIIYSNIDIAICNIINKNKSNYYDFFELFHSEVKENFTKNYDKIVAIAENKKKTFEKPTLYLTDMYHMKVTIDYEKLIEKLRDCKNSFT